MAFTSKKDEGYIISPVYNQSETEGDWVSSEEEIIVEQKRLQILAGTTKDSLLTGTKIETNETLIFPGDKSLVVGEITKEYDKFLSVPRISGPTSLPLHRYKSFVFFNDGFSFICVYVSNYITQGTCAIPYNIIEGAQITKTFDPKISDTKAAMFNADGSKITLFSPTTNEYDVQIPFDVESIDLSTRGPNLGSHYLLAEFHVVNENLILIGSTKLYEYTLVTPYSMVGATRVEHTFSLETFNMFFRFFEQGKYFITLELESSIRRLKIYRLSTAYDLSTRTEITGSYNTTGYDDAQHLFSPENQEDDEFLFYSYSGASTAYKMKIRKGYQTDISSLALAEAPVSIEKPKAANLVDVDLEITDDIGTYTKAFNQAEIDALPREIDGSIKLKFPKSSRRTRTYKMKLNIPKDITVQSAIVKFEKEEVI